MKTKIDFFDSEAIIRLTPIKENTLSIADNILINKWKIFPTLSELNVENINSLWEMKYPSTESTYSLYTYALYPVSYLLNAYEVSGKENYLNKALLISQSFISWINSPNKKLSTKRKKILFGDHAVSNRTQTLCYLLLALNNAQKTVPNELTDQLIRQGEYLSDIDNYSHYNHGLMMDLSLLGLVNVLKGAKYNFPIYFQDNLLQRLNKSLLRDMTEDGVHIENSPGYHFWIVNFYKKISRPLLEVDKELSRKCEKILNKSLEYAKYITRSDGSVPAIGDTHASLKSTPSHTLSSKFFSQSNIVIFRDLEDKVWASFNSGYKTHVHKHADDGAFNLFYKGKDIFFDPGFLNYEDNEDSISIKSASYHNTVKPLYENTTINRLDLTTDTHSVSYTENLTKSRIIGFYSNEYYEASLAIISNYEAGDIFRLVVFDYKGCFLLYDYVLDGNQEFSQGFNINPELKIIFSDEETLISNDLDNVLCSIRQLESPIHPPKKNKPDLQDKFYAKSFNEKAPFKRINFNFSNKKSLIIIDLKDFETKGVNDLNYINSLGDKELFEFVEKLASKF